MQLSIVNNKHRDLLVVNLRADAMVLKLQEEIQGSKLKVSSESQKLSINGVALRPENKLSLYGIANGSVIVLEDLGVMLDMRKCYVSAFLGPVIIHGLFLLRLYDSLSSTQRLAYACLIVHSGKWILEALFLHHYGHPKLPLSLFFILLANYWGLSGL